MTCGANAADDERTKRSRRLRDDLGDPFRLCQDLRCTAGMAVYQSGRNSSPHQKLRRVKTKLWNHSWPRQSARTELLRSIHECGKKRMFTFKQSMSAPQLERGPNMLG